MHLNFTYLHLALLAFVLLIPGLRSANAQDTPTESVSTPPIGFTSVNALGNSDTRLSAPLQRAPVWQGVVSSVNGNEITFNNESDAGNLLVAWNVNQFVYQAGTQSNTYYVLFLTGSKAGSSYTVTGNSAGGNPTGNITVDLNGDTIDGSNNESAVAAGDSLCIIPYWSLSTLFPNQAGITGTSAASGTGAGTKIYFMNLTATGINLPPSSAYFYYTGSGGTGPSWRHAGSGTANLNDQIIPPNQYVLIRQDGLSDNTVPTIFGTASILTDNYVLSTLEANTAQDISLAVNAFAPLTLSQSGLFESGAFAGTTSPNGSTGGDHLLIYDDTLAIENKPFSASYFYYTGTGGTGPGWRQVGSGTANMNDQIVLQPGSGFIIRKAATPEPQSATWLFSPPYAQAPSQSQ